jgi:hypothetical protein
MAIDHFLITLELLGERNTREVSNFVRLNSLLGGFAILKLDRDFCVCAKLMRAFGVIVRILNARPFGCERAFVDEILKRHRGRLEMGAFERRVLPGPHISDVTAIHAARGLMKPGGLGAIRVLGRGRATCRGKTQGENVQREKRVTQKSLHGTSLTYNRKYFQLPIFQLPSEMIRIAAMRPARSEDLPVLLEMVSEYHSLDHLPFEAREIEPVLSRLMADPSLGRIWIVEQTDLERLRDIWCFVSGTALNIRDAMRSLMNSTFGKRFEDAVWGRPHWILYRIKQANSVFARCISSVSVKTRKLFRFTENTDLKIRIAC